MDNLIAPHGSHIVNLVLEEERVAELAESLADEDRLALRATDAVIDTSTISPEEETREVLLFLEGHVYIPTPEKG